MSTQSSAGRAFGLRSIKIDPDVDLQATDLPGSGSVKRLAAATGLTAYAEDPGVPFPRPEVHTPCHSLLSQAIFQLGGQGRSVYHCRSMSALQTTLQCLSHVSHQRLPPVRVLR